MRADRAELAAVTQLRRSWVARSYDGYVDQWLLAR
jgi:hypothetical protein